MLWKSLFCDGNVRMLVHQHHLGQRKFFIVICTLSSIMIVLIKVAVVCGTSVWIVQILIDFCAQYWWMKGHFLINHSVCFSNSVRKHVTEIQAAEMGVDPTDAQCSLRHMLERTYIPMPGYANAISFRWSCPQGIAGCFFWLLFLSIVLQVVCRVLLIRCDSILLYWFRFLLQDEQTNKQTDKYSFTSFRSDRYLFRWNANLDWFGIWI